WSTHTPLAVQWWKRGDGVAISAGDPTFHFSANPRYRRSSKIVGGNPWPSLLSSLRPVLCAPKSGLPSRTFCVLVHCHCAICDLKFTMGFAANPDTIKQADVDCFSL